MANRNLWKLAANMMVETCANCGKVFQTHNLNKISDVIRNHKPACNYECNKDLGQID